MKGKTDDDLRSRMSKMTGASKRSLSKSELAKFFTDKKAEIQEDVKSRFSRGSRGSGVQGFKAKFMKKIEDQNEANKKAHEEA